jgi:alpha-glucosidase
MTPWTAEQWVPHAQGADVQLTSRGNLRLRFLSDSMARVTLQPKDGYREPNTWAIAPVNAHAPHDVPWQGRHRDDLSCFATPAVQHHKSQGLHVLSTPSLRVELHTQPLRLVWHWQQDGHDEVVLSDRSTSAYLSDKRTGALRHYIQRDDAEKFYGLGDKTGPLNLSGRRLRTLAMDSLGYDPEHGDPLYKHWPFVLSRTPNGRWLGVYYDTLASCTFDFGCEHDNYHDFYRYVDIDDGELDYYVMVGNTPAEVLQQFMTLIGGTHLPPRWTVGYAQTAMGLADSPDAQHQLSTFIDLTQQHKLPVSAFHYGSGYSSRGKRRYVFTWNHDKFPDPKSLNQKFHAHGMHLVANIKPCLLDDHPAFEGHVKNGLFIQDSAHQPVVEPYWDGQGAHLDFTNPKAVQWWQTQLKAQILDMGIDAGWNDNNEYAILNEDAQSNGWGHAIAMHRSRPLHALLMTRATFESQEQALGRDNVFTVTRAGPPGIQRYAQTWSGDNTTSWRTLKWNIRTGLQMSLSGMFNVGHDVGGFYGPLPDPELFLRWVQASCLNPRMVMNSWKAGNVSNLPWMHPEVKDDVIRAIELRYTLMPYLWSLFERASSHHEPIIRPTFYDFHEDMQCFEDSDDFMLGSWLLVAPVVHAGQTKREVYLPQLAQGECWFDFETGERFAAGQTHTVPAPMNKLPLFARQGARIACAAAQAGQVAKFDDPIHQTRNF